MENANTKNLKTQLALYKEVRQADHMILYYVQSSIENLLRKTIQPKMYLKDKQTTVELPVDEFNELRVLMANISQDDSLGLLGNGAVEKYLKERNEKLRIIGMLTCDE